jgi:alanine-glyoxylate transaminase/serine-glyoxylate transaminase/serine-pyruvate transaminase
MLIRIIRKSIILSIRGKRKNGKSIGMDMLVAREFRLPMLNAVHIPEEVNDANARQQLRQQHGIEIGAGLGPLAGKIWRIGLMGHTARMENIERLIQALKSVCKR